MALSVNENASRPPCRLLTSPDVEPAAEVIAHAFMNDPLCMLLLPNTRTRLNTLRKFFRAYGEIYVRSQCGYGIGEPLHGVAFWLEPGHTNISISLSMLKIFIPVLFTHYPIGYFRARSVIKYTNLLHQKYASGPHYYLDNIGVRPASQGQGYSSGLMLPFLAKAKAQGVPVYTDTVTHSNVPYYEHFGFNCMEECSVAGAGITIWALLKQLP